MRRWREAMARRSSFVLLGMTFVCGWASTFADDRFAEFNKNPLLVAPTGPLSPEEQKSKFQLPPGFEIELVASEPAINKPMNIIFDAKGRLWVTSSLEYPYPAKEGQGRDDVRVFEDADQDGRFEKMTIFADKLNIPIGVCPVPEGVLCHSIPTIWLLRDTDGDGKADERKVAYSQFGFIDTHGMANSFTHWIDGWVYGTHGFSNTSNVAGADRQTIAMQSGNTYRMRTDGSHIEYWTHGQVNPFGLSMDSLGNLFSADCHTKPAYQLLRGAWYPSFGKPHDGLGFGPELLDHLHGSTGIAGIIRYSADQFPPDYQGRLFIGNPVTGRINSDELIAHGSTYRGVERPDLLSCKDPWFRPVAMTVAPDGTLYVADFYNKIIGHYEVPLEHPARDRHRGRIWRIVYRGTTSAPAPPPRSPGDLSKAGASRLIELLGHPNLGVRTMATHEIVHRIGPRAAEQIDAMVKASSSKPIERAHGLWILFRWGKLTPSDFGQFARDRDPLVRVHAAKALAETPWTSDRKDSCRALTEALLSDSDPFVRRAAADAMGRHPNATHLPALLELWTSTDPKDTHLIHVARMALRDTMKGDPSWRSIADASSVRDSRLYADVCLGLPDAHSARFLTRHLTSAGADRERLQEFLRHAARYADAATLSELLAAARLLYLSDPSTQRRTLLGLHAGLQERGIALPPDVRRWANELARQLIVDRKEGSLSTGIDLARDLRLTERLTDLSAVAADKSAAAPLRRQAIDGMIAIDGKESIASLRAILVDQEQPLPIRRKVAEALGTVSRPESAAMLAEQLATAPSALAMSLARGLARSDRGADLLITQVEKGAAPAPLLRDGVVANELRHRAVANKEKRLAEVLKDVPADDDRLNEIVRARRSHLSRAKSDVARGSAIFEKSCGKCHQLAGKGARVGPQLDGIGLRGVDRLLEDILKPNENVDQAFRGTVVVMNDGRIVNGLALREEGEVLILADAEGREQRLPIAEIESRRISRLSPMPADVAIQLSESEFADLMAYLLTQREKKG